MKHQILFPGKNKYHIINKLSDKYTHSVLNDKAQYVIMMLWCFTSLSTLFKAYRHDGNVIMKGSVQ